MFLTPGNLGPLDVQTFEAIRGMNIFLLYPVDSQQA
jgi:hypothetical protein